MVFLTLFIIPLLIVVISFIFFKGISWKEFLILIGIVLVITGISSAICYYQNVYFTEMINGQVVNKSKDKVSCSHSYSCNCRTECSGSGKDKSCSTVCDTCYEHDYDYDYNVKDTTNYYYEIDRVDSQGLVMPKRWQVVNMGDPTTHKSSYKNYLKATGDTLFRKQGLIEKYKNDLPDYPEKIYDYYKINRIIKEKKISLEKYAYWNNELSEINGRLGVKKQVNLILVIVFDKPSDYIHALDQHWLGGNKNDAIVIISVDKDSKILWVGTLALVQDNMFQIQMRDNIMAIETFDMEKILFEMELCVLKYYKRKHIKDFEYLMYSVTPTIF